MKAPKFPVCVTTARARVTKAKPVKLSGKVEIVTAYRITASSAKMRSEAVRTVVHERPTSLLSAGTGGSYSVDCVSSRPVAMKLGRADVKGLFSDELRRLIACGQQNTPQANRLKAAYDAVRAGKTVVIG